MISLVVFERTSKRGAMGLLVVGPTGQMRDQIWACFDVELVKSLSFLNFICVLSNVNAVNADVAQ